MYSQVSLSIICYNQVSYVGTLLTTYLKTSWQGRQLYWNFTYNLFKKILKVVANCIGTLLTIYLKYSGSHRQL